MPHCGRHIPHLSVIRGNCLHSASRQVEHDNTKNNKTYCHHFIPVHLFMKEDCGQPQHHDEVQGGQGVKYLERQIPHGINSEHGHQEEQAIGDHCKGIQVRTKGSSIPGAGIRSNLEERLGDAGQHDSTEREEECDGHGGVPPGVFVPPLSRESTVIPTEIRHRPMMFVMVIPSLNRIAENSRITKFTRLMKG